MVSLQRLLNSDLVKNEELINSKKIHLNYQQISSIGDVPYSFTHIQKLYLSHNQIEHLNGIECFTLLTQLSLSYNAILDINELYHISNKSKLLCLSIKGNFMCKHPNYVAAIVTKFPRYESHQPQRA